MHILVDKDGVQQKEPPDAGLRMLAARWKMDRGEDPEDPLGERLAREAEGWREKDPDSDGTFFTLVARIREARKHPRADAEIGRGGREWLLGAG